MYQPSKYILTSGIGADVYQLVSFDKALSASKISDYNLVKVSSILPPQCLESDFITIPKGSVLFTAYSSISSCKYDTTISAAIAVGIPKSPYEIGVIMEFSGINSVDVSINNVKQMIYRSMKLRNIAIKEIKVASSEAVVREGFSTAVAALAMW